MSSQYNMNSDMSFVNPLSVHERISNIKSLSKFKIPQHISLKMLKEDILKSRDVFEGNRKQYVDTYKVYTTTELKTLSDNTHKELLKLALDKKYETLPVIDKLLKNYSVNNAFLNIYEIWVLSCALRVGDEHITTSLFETLCKMDACEYIIMGRIFEDDSIYINN